jgi:SAM-dependent methyltransferase
MPKRWVADLPKDLPKSFERLLSRIEKVNRTRMLITRQYLHDMRMAFREMARVLRPGGHVVLVIGNNQVCGESLRNDAFAKLVFDDAGLSLDLDLVDDIKSRGLMTKRNKTASMISRECVLVFKKRGG